jgi:hypothetical protein
MTEEKTEIFKISIPLLDENKTHVLINFDLTNYEQLSEGFDLYLIKDGSSNKRLYSEQNWDEGKSFSITPGDVDFWCSEACTYSIFLTAPANAIFEISSQAYDNYRQINVGDLIKDSASANSEETYILLYEDITNPNKTVDKSLQIEVLPYHG